MSPRVTTTWKRKKKRQRLGQEASQAREKGNRNGSHSKNNRSREALFKVACGAGTEAMGSSRVLTKINIAKKIFIENKIQKFTTKKSKNRYSY